jgi:hypothetical protein
VIPASAREADRREEGVPHARFGGGELREGVGAAEDFERFPVEHRIIFAGPEDLDGSFDFPGQSLLKSDRFAVASAPVRPSPGGGFAFSVKASCTRQRAAAAETPIARLQSQQLPSKSVRDIPTSTYW